jgi:hypothetical protein
MLPFFPQGFSLWMRELSVRWYWIRGVLSIVWVLEA